MGNCPICREDTLEYGGVWIKGLGYQLKCYNCKYIGYTHEPQCDEGFFEYMKEVS